MNKESVVWFHTSGSLLWFDSTILKKGIEGEEKFVTRNMEVLEIESNFNFLFYILQDLNLISGLMPCLHKSECDSYLHLASLQWS